MHSTILFILSRPRFLVVFEILAGRWAERGSLLPLGLFVHPQTPQIALITQIAQIPWATKDRLYQREVKLCRGKNIGSSK